MLKVAKQMGGLAGALLFVAAFLACTDGNGRPRAEQEVAASPQDEGLAATPATCSRKRVPHVRSGVRTVAYARGSGPVFVGLGAPDIVHYTVDTKKHNGWYYYKTLWAIDSEYGGAVTISGNQTEGPNELRFNAASGFPGEKLTELHFPETDDAEWRYGPSATLIHAEGCYAFRIEGEDFVEWVKFIARAED